MAIGGRFTKNRHVKKQTRLTRKKSKKSRGGVGKSRVSVGLERTYDHHDTQVHASFAPPPEAPSTRPRSPSHVKFTMRAPEEVAKPVPKRAT
jgi:hypothetical protein